MVYLENLYNIIKYNFIQQLLCKYEKTKSGGQCPPPPNIRNQEVLKKGSGSIKNKEN